MDMAAIGHRISTGNQLAQTNFMDPDWIVADDFISDGRAIYCVRWWGSYFDNQQPGFEDGFVLSFFSDAPVTSTNRFSRPQGIAGHLCSPDFGCSGGGNRLSRLG